MADSYVAKSEQTGPNAPEESLLAGKYKSQEELEKGTLELIKKQSGGDLESVYKTLESKGLTLDLNAQNAGWTQEKEGQQQIPSEQNQEDEGQQDKQDQQSEEQEQQQSQSREDAKTVLEQQGLNIEDFEKEFAENGELSEESYQKLQEFFPKNVIDSYIAGQQALIQQSTNELMGIAGGQENYNAMIQWASENLSEEEINYFNKAIESGDMTQAKFAVQGLVARYQQETGKGTKGNKPNLIQGQSVDQQVPAGYQSKVEMIRDMQDPRYHRDPAFRKQVEDKLAKTTAF